jgi:hypothetical protein
MMRLPMGMMLAVVFCLGQSVCLWAADDMVATKDTVEQPSEPSASQVEEEGSEKQNKIKALKQRQQELIQGYHDEKELLSKSFQEKMALFEESQHYHQIRVRLINELSRRQGQLKETFEAQLLNLQKEERLLRFGREELNLWGTFSQEALSYAEDEQAENNEELMSEAKRQFLLRREMREDDEEETSGQLNNESGSGIKGTNDSGSSGYGSNTLYQRQLKKKMVERYRQRQERDQNN